MHVQLVTDCALHLFAKGVCDPFESTGHHIIFCFSDYLQYSAGESAISSPVGPRQRYMVCASSSTHKIETIGDVRISFPDAAGIPEA